MNEKPDRQTIEVILFKSAITGLAQQLLEFYGNVDIMWKCQSNITGMYKV